MEFLAVFGPDRLNRPSGKKRLAGLARRPDREKMPPFLLPADQRLDARANEGIALHGEMAVFIYRTV